MADAEKIMELEKELEDLKKRLPTYKDRACGQMVHSDPMGLWLKIEELEAEIERLKGGGKGESV